MSPVPHPSPATHQCLTPTSPGRFFAASQLKLFLAYIILNYELKPEIDGHRPPNKFFAYVRIPDISVGVMFRERKDRKQSFANSLIPVERD